MNEHTSRQVRDYGRLLVSRVAGDSRSPDPSWVAPFLSMLGGNQPNSDPSAPLQWILSRIVLDDASSDPLYLRPEALTTRRDNGERPRWRLSPVSLAEAQAAGRQQLYQEFLHHADAQPDDFVHFFHLMRKYASTLPNTYGEPGVSLFEQWKTIAALVEISGTTEHAPEKLGLVSGDIPGIQRTINMITSKGAAKAMRGRSAFIQLLGHATVDRLLAKLQLGMANVVYDAGGNFLLLIGWDDDAEQAVREASNRINKVLLAGTDSDPKRFKGFHGDLAVALAAVEIQSTALSFSSSQTDEADKRGLWSKAEGRVKNKVISAKSRPFGDLALDKQEDKGWGWLFDPEPATTIDFCAVCRRQRQDDEQFVPLDPEVAEGGVLQCPECAGFNKLANDLARGSRLLIDMQQPADTAGWQQALFEVCGKWYSIGREKDLGDITLALGLDGFPGERVDGFKLLANTTPITTQGAIKPNDELAEASQGGMKRLGVLRMDVDNLGNLIVNGLPHRTLMSTAELSQALERFFAGWLEQICQRIGRNLFYVLFAGGDDLFVIGPWSKMPELAQAIQQDFADYAGGHSAIHLSAGIAVIGAKSPIYAGAELSDEAIDAAKEVKGKNSIAFLGHACRWTKFNEVDHLQEDIVELVDGFGLPNSFVTRLRSMARRYQDDREGQSDAGCENHSSEVEPAVPIYYGPWMWQQAYAIARLVDAHSRAGEKLYTLQTGLLSGQIEDLGLAARWAQWLTRKE